MLVNNIEINVERCNMGVLFLAAYRAEVNTAELLGEVESEHRHLESAIGGHNIPTFEAQLEKFQKEGYTPISEYVKSNPNVEDGEISTEDAVYSDERLSCIPHLAETTYLIALAYNLLGKHHLIGENNTTLEEFISICADQAMEDVLLASQAMDYRFSENNYAQELPVMTAICPQITTLEYLNKYDALNAVNQLGGFDGIVKLGLFINGVTQNILSLSEEYSDASYNYIY